MKVNTDQLHALLADIDARVTAYDSFEGTITYEAIPGKPGELEVSARYRIGNNEGQGSWRIIPGAPPPGSTVKHNVELWCGDTLTVGQLNDFEQRELLSLLVSRSAFRNDSCEERKCDHCEQPYRGPAVFCCHACAMADA
jgi:hypothetical protein